MKRFFSVLAVIAVAMASNAQFGTLTSRWVQAYFKRLSYTDRVSVTGAGGANPLTVGSHYYPYYSYPVPSTGDSYVTAFGPLTPFLTGVTQFAMDPVAGTGANITTATLAAGGLVITKTNAFTNYTRRSGDYVKVNSGTLATAGYYAVASRDSADQITLSTTAGTGGGAADLSFTVIRPNNDAIVVSRAYNYTNVAGLKSVAAEPSMADILETNYAIYNSGSPIRTAEWYTTFRAASGNPGNEIRPMTFEYDVTNHKIFGSGLMASDENYSAVFDFKKPNGTGAIDTGTAFFRIGWSNDGTGDKNGALNGLQHLGHTGEDTLVDIQAPTDHNAKLQLGAAGTAGIYQVVTSGVDKATMTVGSASAFFRLCDTNTNAQGAVAINITGNDATAGLQVASWHTSGTSLLARGITSQTAPVFRVQDANGATGQAAWGAAGDIFAIDLTGYQYVKTGTLAAAGNNSQTDAAQIVAPMTRITGVSAGVTDGFKLPAAVAGMVVEGYNSTATAGKLWPASGDSLNGNTADTSLTVAAHRAFRAVAYDATDWMVIFD